MRSAFSVAGLDRREPSHSRSVTTPLRIPVEGASPTAEDLKAVGTGCGDDGTRRRRADVQAGDRLAPHPSPPYFHHHILWRGVGIPTTSSTSPLTDLVHRPCVTTRAPTTSTLPHRNSTVGVPGARRSIARSGSLRSRRSCEPAPPGRPSRQVWSSPNRSTTPVTSTGLHHRPASRPKLRTARFASASVLASASSPARVGIDDRSRRGAGTPALPASMRASAGVGQPVCSTRARSRRRLTSRPPARTHDAGAVTVIPSSTNAGGTDRGGPSRRRRTGSPSIRRAIAQGLSSHRFRPSDPRPRRRGPQRG